MFNLEASGFIMLAAGSPELRLIEGLRAQERIRLAIQELKAEQDRLLAKIEDLQLALDHAEARTTMAAQEIEAAVREEMLGG